MVSAYARLCTCGAERASSTRHVSDCGSSIPHQSNLVQCQGGVFSSQVKVKEQVSEIVYLFGIGLTACFGGGPILEWK